MYYVVMLLLCMHTVCYCGNTIIILFFVYHQDRWFRPFNEQCH